MLPVPTVNQLATFTGRDVASLGPFAGEALTQATLIFTIMTNCTAFPDDPDLLMLAQNAIMQLADRLLLEQPFQQTVATPFSSETIGSYSYSKSTPTALTALSRQAELTGLFWWDLAMDLLTCGDRSLVNTGSLSAMEDDHVYSQVGNPYAKRVIGPADMCQPDLPFDVNAETPHQQ